MHAYTRITIHNTMQACESVCLSCKTVDAKLSILFPDDKIENVKKFCFNIVEHTSFTKYDASYRYTSSHGYFGYFKRNPFNVS